MLFRTARILRAHDHERHGVARSRRWRDPITEYDTEHNSRGDRNSRCNVAFPP